MDIDICKAGFGITNEQFKHVVVGSKIRGKVISQIVKGPVGAMIFTDGLVKPEEERWAEMYESTKDKALHIPTSADGEPDFANMSIVDLEKEA